MSDTPRQGPPPEHERKGRFAARYGESPLHLAGFAITFAVAGWAALQLADLRGATTILLWFAGAIVLHDLVLYPAYALLDRATQRTGVSINHVRVPALLSGLLLLAWFPLISGRAPGLYRSVTGVEPPDYLARWLLITAGLFAGSLAVAALRRARKPRAGRRAGAEDGV
ncbi:MAG TPA: hypothetical protein VGW75_06320 [Solirubrobacteraceae bacterium]|nr:hypothetical protein [Solirubrobacteraceae bacterium]